MMFGGLKVVDVGEKQWKQFAEVKSALGLRHNSPPAIARLAEVLIQYTNIPHILASAVSKILTKHPIDKIGLNGKETELVIQFLTENREGIELVEGAKYILNEVLPKKTINKQEKNDGNIQDKNGESKSVAPKKKRKPRSDKGKTKAKKTEQIREGSPV